MMKSKSKIMAALGLALMVTATAGAQNNSKLSGNYAFSFTGMTTGNGTTSTPFASIGRFTADGAGNLTNGELDSNGVGPMEKAVALAFTGTYSIGADNRGVMNLNIPGGGTLAFAMVANGNAKFVEIDASGGHGTVGAGTIEKADAAAYSTARITGDYAFGVAGQEQSNTSRTAIAGRFTANGAGILANGAADENQNGTFTTLNLLAGTYMVTDTATGRGIMNLPPAIGGALQNLDFVFYVVSSEKLFVMDMDVVSPTSPLLIGTVLQQQTPLGGFSNPSLNGGMVIYLMGIASGPVPCAGGGLINADGVATLTVTYDQNCGSESIANTLGTYNVTSNGRAAIRVAGAYVVAYLVGTNQGFLVVPDNFVSSGFGESQAPRPLTNSAVAGKYAGSITSPTSLNQTIFSGQFNADGTSPTGALSGTEDIGAPAGPTVGASFNAAYSIFSSPTNGRGSIDGSTGTAIILVISPSKFVVVSSGSSTGMAAGILVFEH